MYVCRVTFWTFPKLWGRLSILLAFFLRMGKSCTVVDHIYLPGISLSLSLLSKITFLEAFSYPYLPERRAFAQDRAFFSPRAPSPIVLCAKRNFSLLHQLRICRYLAHVLILNATVSSFLFCYFCSRDYCSLEERCFCPTLQDDDAFLSLYFHNRTSCALK